MKPLTPPFPTILAFTFFFFLCDTCRNSMKCFQISVYPDCNNCVAFIVASVQHRYPKTVILYEEGRSCQPVAYLKDEDNALENVDTFVKAQFSLL